jgi:hypothetical protein
MAFGSTATARWWQRTSSQSRINDFNPDDIETVETSRGQLA